MVRFTYTQTLSPSLIHHFLVLAGTVPHLYTYRPRENRWTLHVGRKEAEAVRLVLDRLGIEFEERALASRFSN